MTSLDELKIKIDELSIKINKIERILYGGDGFSDSLLTTITQIQQQLRYIDEKIDKIEKSLQQKADKEEFRSLKEELYREEKERYLSKKETIALITLISTLSAFLSQLLVMLFH